MTLLRSRDLLLGSTPRIQELGASLARRSQAPDLSTSTVDQILKALNSTLIAQTFDGSQAVSATENAVALGSGFRTHTAIFVPEPVLVTGLAFYVNVAGVYTASNNNKVGLSKIAINGADIDMVASSVNDGNLWKTAGVIQKPFANSVVLEAGLYFTEQLFSASSVTTAPKCGALTPLTTNLTNALIPASPWRVSNLSGQTDLVDPVLISSFANATSVIWHALY